MKKFICVICAVCLMAALAGCGKKTENAPTGDSAADFTASDGEIFSDVPTEDYGGMTFRVLNARTGSPASAMDTDTVNGDILNEALYRRNGNVEERLNVLIEEERDKPEKIYDIAVTSCLAGEDTYGAVWNTASYMAAMATGGYLVTSDYLTEINLTKPWWNTAAISGCAVDGAQYLLYGDLQLSFYDAHSIVGFNMSMIRDFDGLSDPYKLASDGNWTFDTMLSMMTAVSGDIDGDGAYTADDRYGVSLGKSEALSLVFGGGGVMSSLDGYGLPVVSCADDEYFYNVFKKVSDTFYSGLYTVYDTDKNAADSMSAAAMFKSGHSLFYVATVGALSTLRDMDYEFGVLPMPKYDASASGCISYLSPDDATALGVMACGKNLLRTGVVLENLAAESCRDGGLRDCYIDTVLSFKYVNDEKSRENLLSVIDSGTFDLADVYNWGSLRETLEGLCGNTGVFASRLAAVRTSVASDLNKTIEQINKYR